jgi:aspartokinase-like uncharacterized kinase
MRDEAWIIVKVGGSLFDWPDLRSRLIAWLAQLGDANVLIVPGGGATADAIRALDAMHHLGEEAAHWLAIQALSVNTRFLHALLPSTRIVAENPILACPAGSYVLDALPFFQADEMRSDHLPHCWHITSDSLAVRLATLVKARELILLKSIDWPGTDWAAASRAGIVDGYFTEAVQKAPINLRVRIVNLRVWV